ncbi:dienelactone hydrolase family protein [Pseudoduganella sp. LjRoot289]|uniref:dienelactone hydrolase family protein n=1 Tax=Pseudoduganella sp. LjRoot289 TaxID=3342314 RepID=UPI003ECD83AE
MNGTSKWIDIAGADGTFGAYLALPRSANGKAGGPGIVLLQEIFGVNEHIRSVAEQYAADGYVVLAPDLFWRQGARIELGYGDEDWKRAVALKSASNIDQAQADIHAAALALRALPGVDAKIASLGFCYGGLLSYHAAANGHVDAAIAYYGGGIQNALQRADQIRVPLMMHFGGKDSYIPHDAVKKIAERFDDRDNIEVHVYTEAEHGFNCNHRATYRQQPAALAHGHSLVFLSETL